MYYQSAAVILIICIALYVVQVWFRGHHDDQHYRLIIGILSSRSHFSQRHILRKGIYNQIGNKSILVKFIMSNKPCYIPEQYRVDPYRCEKDNFVKQATEFFRSHQLTQYASLHVFVPNGPIGVDFIVHHSIVIKELALFDFNQDGFLNALKVILYNMITHEPVVAASFFPFKNGRLNDSYRYKAVQEYVLPQGFHGSIVVEGFTEDDPLFRGGECCEVNGRGMITFQKGYRYGYEVGEFPLHRNTHVKSDCYLAGASLVFASYGIPQDSNTTAWLRERDKQYEQRTKQLHREEIALEAEELKYGDILMVNTIESYRGLPSKMLMFYEWLTLSKKYDFVMKTDDDCYVNVTGVLQALRDISHHGNDNVWLGSFRTNFALDKQGKWAEHEYMSASYPPFPCGSGYVLSRDIVQWISDNKHRLKIFQGEDTSLGIWLAAIGPTRIHDDRFRCVHGCKENMFTSPENSLYELQLYYKNENMTTHLCDRFD